MKNQTLRRSAVATIIAVMVMLSAAGSVFAVTGVNLVYSTDGNGTVTEWMLRGDVDRDGVITDADVTLINNYIFDNTLLTDPLAIEAADTDHSGVVSPTDATLLNDLLYDNGQFPNTAYDFRVVDTPNSGYEIDTITVNGSALVVPAKGATSITIINNVGYNVSVSADGVVEVDGLSVATNEVVFTHKATSTTPTTPTTDTTTDTTSKDTADAANVKKASDTP